MNGEDEEEEEEEKEEEEKEKEKNILTSHVNCLEETSHHAVPHGMWHMLLLKDCGIGKLSKDDMKAELCIVVHSMMIITSSNLRHTSILL